MFPNMETERNDSGRNILIKKLSFAQMIGVFLFCFVLSSVAGFASGIVGIISIKNNKFQETFPILKDIKFKENIENVIEHYTEEKEKRKVEETSGIIEAIEKAKPSVVSIVVKDAKYSFFWDTVIEDKKAGTGFFLTVDGLIATNKHVVKKDSASSKREITVITDLGDSFDAEVVAEDPVNDLAFLKITDSRGKSFPILNFADSSDLVVGQRVIAIGNALGENDNTATSGIISAIGKYISLQDSFGNFVEFEGMIQIDAALNPGNSGGPLVDLDGNVVGINTAGMKEAELINYAIPSNAIEPALKSYLKFGEIRRPYLGVRARTITKSLKAFFEIDEIKGALIIPEEEIGTKSVAPNSPAEKAGLKSGDIILSIGGKEINPTNTLGSILSNFDPGEKVKIAYKRDGKILETEAELGDYKKVIKN